MRYTILLTSEYNSQTYFGLVQTPFAFMSFNLQSTDTLAIMLRFDRHNKISPPNVNCKQKNDVAAIITAFFKYNYFPLAVPSGG